MNDDLARQQRHVSLVVDPCPAERFPSYSGLALLNKVRESTGLEYWKTNRSTMRYRVDALAWLRWITNFFSILEEAGLALPVAALPSTLNCCDLCDANLLGSRHWRCIARTSMDGELLPEPSVMNLFATHVG